MHSRNYSKCFINVNLNYPHIKPMKEVLSLTPLTAEEIEKERSYITWSRLLSQ